MTKLMIPMLVSSLASCAAADPCSESHFGGEVCQPDAGMAAGSELTIQVIESTCASACDRTRPRCEVSQVGSVLTLTLVRRTCPVLHLPTTVCIAVCAVSVGLCRLPPLPPGDYILRSEGHPDATLSIGGGQATSCSGAILPLE